MDSLTLAIIILVALVVVGAVVVMLKRSWGGSLDRSYRPPVSAAAPAQPRALAGQDLAEVSSLLAGGNKSAAIKRYRELTGLGLKEAKDAVETIERSGTLPDALPAVAAPGVGRRDLSAADLADIRALRDRGNKIAAIKRYRELT